MINILNMKLSAVKAQDAVIVNKRTPDGEPMRITLSRKHELVAGTTDKYLGYCTVELQLTSEENLPIDEHSFYVKVCIVGEFTCTEPKENITDDLLITTIAIELFPHARSCMSALMVAAGIEPYLIPSSLIPELS